MTATLLNVENLSVRFPVKRRWGQSTWLYAVDDVSFEVKRGETLSIVGESGSGKTTAALGVARLVPNSAGHVVLGGEDFLKLEGEDLRRARAKIQMIFQDPYSSLNPRLRAEAIVREPMDSIGTAPVEDRPARVAELFEQVGLRPEQMKLFPHQFSGGQRQRIGIARALSTNPELIICDEAVSALDVAVQAQILNLLRRLQRDLGLTYLFISHDLGVVQHMSDHIAVMYMGKIVEYADRLSLFNDPKHPYTKALLSAVPSVDRARKVERMLIPGDPPDPLNPPKGCRFASRCPLVEDACRAAQPPLDPVGNDHRVACIKAS
ncbi:ABC transporter ATP-binding protein [Litoreibacter arenae]|uniref:Oligopeptide transport ATP-binding protein OppF n=1 Tax=Litoreibacter arenae DSM 19593 TaxID=1123360 RepID=S9RZH7_9RHOB|nr:ABC transporter ATP-binding protein [Litoreibacter arenae]EPX79394.1 Oligopeptide transport ATP-binding protein OppF [Litoreibacter arenae DSM 19593]